MYVTLNLDSQTKHKGPHSRDFVTPPPPPHVAQPFVFVQGTRIRGHTNQNNNNNNKR